MAFYVEVAGLDALRDHARGWADRFRKRPPFDRDYGMREFHVIDPDGALVFVGEAVEGREEG